MATAHCVKRLSQPIMTPEWTIVLQATEWIRLLCPKGTYTLTVGGTGEDTAATGDLDITESVNINGAGQFSTTIDGNAIDRVFHIDPGQLFGVEVTLADLTVRNGSASQGGGIYADAMGSLTVMNSTIAENTAIGEGGGIYNFSEFSTLNVVSSTISNNTSGDPINMGDGSGIYNEGQLTLSDTKVVSNTARGVVNVGVGSMTINASTISNNLGGISNGGIGEIKNSTVSFNNRLSYGAGGIETSWRLAISNTFVVSNTTVGRGGGIDNSGYMTITNSTISHNRADGTGGGIHNGTFDLPLTIINSTISDNISDEGGGGVYNDGNLTLTGSTVSGNTVTAGSVIGGGIYQFSGNMVIEGSTISGNSVTGFGYSSGGGIMLQCCLATIKNSTISGNSAYVDGGGLLVSRDVDLDPLVLNNVTITDNTADANADGLGGGGGLAVYGTSSQLIAIQNSIIAGNQAISFGNDDCTSFEGGIISRGYNLVGIEDGCYWTVATGDILGSETVPIDPLLSALADHGGNNMTHALLEGSPAIDAGNPQLPGSGFNTCEVMDQRGLPRLHQSVACDMGAYEVQKPPVYLPTVLKQSQ
jgi:hypothetical protein